MKPSRKVSRRSFMTMVSGGIPPSGVKGLGGQGKGAVESDYDLGRPGGPGGGAAGGDPDSGPH